MSGPGRAPLWKDQTIVWTGDPSDKQAAAWLALFGYEVKDGEVVPLEDDE